MCRIARYLVEHDSFPRADLPDSPFRVPGLSLRPAHSADRLMLVDPGENGQYPVIMRYGLHGSAAVVGEINTAHRPTADSLRELTERLQPTHVRAYPAAPGIAVAFGVMLAPGASHLLARDEEGRSVIRRWPHPAAANR